MDIIIVAIVAFIFMLAVGLLISVLLEIWDRLNKPPKNRYRATGNPLQPLSWKQRNDRVGK